MKTNDRGKVKVILKIAPGTQGYSVTWFLSLTKDQSESLPSSAGVPDRGLSSIHGAIVKVLVMDFFSYKEDPF